MPITTDSPARAAARARMAELARSGIDVSNRVAAGRAARGTAAGERAKAITQGISREQLGRVLYETDQPAAHAAMIKTYGRDYMSGLPPAAQAGLPVTAAGLLKDAAVMAGGYVAGQLGERLLGGVTSGGNGGNGMDGNRYGGWTDLGIEGPGIFQPKDVTPSYYGGVTKQWVANGTLFQRNENGSISVQRKDGTVKTYKPYRPIVFGKKTDARKLARVARKHRSIYKELHKLFGTRTRTVKK